ncbi:MAG: D-alanine--D-alanine ligase [Hamadaea sp.]|uniref:D-alanine--D-alanine ligase family protein n=1 Tax=Hamadaea sp. TaxID=2024425 RepID=UPI0017BEB910|nr:D-alanine--D-alanine ligase family protein [Hamadaea sp.]NUR70213.1 D-alanine--D-alanine ligase [Hamadaea sp.]NUT21866.1 D-alanine--D-alanine ligase [Hamadaea sp.]
MSETPRKTRVAVIFGGRSTEHAISAVSAGSILAALDPAEYEVVPIGITREGRWVLTSGDPSQLSITAGDGPGRLPEITAESGDQVILPGDPTGSDLVLAGGAALTTLEPSHGSTALSDIDVVFPALHGAYGEDGTIQGLLEMAGIPYVGANVFASAAAMDKEFTKKLAVVEGIPVGPYAVLRAGQSLAEEDKQRLGLPVFVKPSRAGSSFGITRVNDWADLDAAIATARAIDPKVLVEAAIFGREVECGVLEGEFGGAPEASALAEVHVSPDHVFYDFEAKYLEDATTFDIPADLPPHVTARIQDLARRTFAALDCAGLARVDFFVANDGEVYLNEINTMPGFTATSMFPRMWAASGVDYPKLVTRLVRTALRRGTGLH